MSFDKLDTAKKLIEIALSLLNDIVAESSTETKSSGWKSSKDFKYATQYFDDFIQEKLTTEIGCETNMKDIRKEYMMWLKSDPDKKKLSPADIRQKLIDKFGKPITRKEKEMFQGVCIAGLLKNVSRNYVEPSAEPPAEEAVEKKEETFVTEQESLTIIEPVVEIKKGGKPKKK